MANIQTLLQRIMSAIYGEEVRSSIHDAIEAINDEVETWTGLQDETVTTVKLASNAVTTAKVADGSITRAKLNADVVDTTLAVSGVPADAKSTGDNIKKRQGMFPLDFENNKNQYLLNLVDKISPGWIRYLRIYNAIPGVTYGIHSTFYNHVTNHTRSFHIGRFDESGNMIQDVFAVIVDNESDEPNNIDVYTNHQQFGVQEVVDVVIDWSKCRTNNYSMKIMLSNDAVSYGERVTTDTLEQLNKKRIAEQNVINGLDYLPIANLDELEIIRNKNLAGYDLNTLKPLYNSAVYGNVAYDFRIDTLREAGVTKLFVKNEKLSTQYNCAYTSDGSKTPSLNVGTIIGDVRQINIDDMTAYDSISISLPESSDWIKYKKSYESFDTSQRGISNWIGKTDLQSGVFDEIVGYAIAENNISGYIYATGEHKYSQGYDTETKLPVWRNANSFRHIYIPIIASGNIKITKPSANQITSVNQFYLLNEDGKVMINSNPKNSTIQAENSFGYSVDENYINVNCKKAYSVGARFIGYSVDISTIPDFECIIDHAIVPDWLGKLSDNERLSDVDIVIPQNLRVCAGTEMNIYYQNIFRYYNTENAHRIYPTNTNFNNNKYFARYTPSVNSSYSEFEMKFRLCADNTTDISKESSRLKVSVVPKNAGAGLSKKVIFIGDSLTDAGVYAHEIETLFSTDAMNVTLLGTRTDYGTPNEGRSGWRAYGYVHCADWNEDVATWGGTPYPPEANPTNPFYNDTEDTFDFSKYMSDQGYDGVDYVFICLGTNDIARGNHSSDAEIIEYWDTMIESIHNYDPNIKIGLWLAPGRALYQNYDRSGIDNSLRANRLIIDTYDGRENENIFLCPVNFNIDPYHDYKYSSQNVSARNSDYQVDICSDSVHPANAGYLKIADVIYGLIKYFGYIDSI